MTSISMYQPHIGPRPDPSLDVLARPFGLTPKEAKIARYIARGDALDTAAKELGMSKESARFHLKRVFHKTDTHRQNQLAVLLLQVALAV